MASLEFPIELDINGKKVSICSPFGSSGILHLYIDKFYYGQFIPFNGKWDLRLQRKGSISEAGQRKLEASIPFVED